MCRLFGMHAGERSVHATFWLLTAPDSVEVQSRREPDGTGIGMLTPDGRPRVDKQPIAAWEDRVFAREARELTSSTFLAHVRYASIGEHTTATDLRAVRYPDTHELHVLDHRTGAPAAGRELHARSPRISAHGTDVVDHILVATEPMADDPRWHLMDPGVLLHVDRHLTVTRTFPFHEGPTRRLTLDELDPVAAASQREGRA